MHYQFPEHERLAYSRNWKVRMIAGLARMLGVLIHIEGLPYGSARNLRRAATDDGGSILGAANLDAKGI
jgi:hypothetical protein